MAVHAVDRGFDMGGIAVDADTETFIAAKFAADVEPCANAAFRIAVDIEAGDRPIARPFCDDVDDAGRGRKAIIERGHALEQFDPLFVFDRHRAEVDDLKRAVEPIIGPGVHQHAARDEIIAGGGAGRLLRDAGRVAKRFFQTDGALGVEQRPGDDGDAGGCVQYRLIAERANLHNVRLEGRALAGDDNLLVQSALDLPLIGQGGRKRTVRRDASRRCGDQPDAHICPPL